MAEPLNGTAQFITELDAWIDGNPQRAGLDGHARDLYRLLKLMEEAGEVASAYYGARGENRRKGVTHSITDVQGELLDVALTALCAHEHFSKDGETMQRLAEHVDRVHARAGLRER